MKDAPESVLHALFDAASQIDGCMLTLFANEHPTAPAALRSWAAARRVALAEHTDNVSRVGRVTVLCTPTRAGFSISVQSWAWPPPSGAPALSPTKEG